VRPASQLNWTKQLEGVLVDPGASNNFMNKRNADQLQIQCQGSGEQISLATTKIDGKGEGVADIDICGKIYHQAQLGPMSDLCADVI